MKKILFGLAAALVSAGAVLAASQPPDAVRLAVQAEIDQAMAPATDDEPDYKPPHLIASAGMFHRVDINDDGVADWVVDFEKAPNASYFCGTGGCRHRIYVSNARGGWDLAMDTQVRTFKLRRSKGKTLLNVDFHGSACGGFGVDPCPRGYVWSGSMSRFVGRAGPKGETFLVGGPLRLVMPPQVSLPGPVLAALADRTARCKAAGATYPYEEAYVAEVEDLNGDGSPDWIIGGEYDGCMSDGSLDPAPVFDLAVFVSAPSGYAVAWRDSARPWGLDLGGDKATFVTLEGAEDCGLNGKDCRKTAWRWNGSALVGKAAEQP